MKKIIKRSLLSVVIASTTITNGYATISWGLFSEEGKANVRNAQILNGEARLTNIEIRENQVQILNDNAVVQNLAIYHRGLQSLHGSSQVFNTVINSYGEQLVYDRARVYETVINGGVQSLQGGYARDTVINQRGVLELYESAKAERAIVNEGGIILVNDDGELHSATANAGGKIFLLERGKSIDTTINQYSEGLLEGRSQALGQTVVKSEAILWLNPGTKVDNLQLKGDVRITPQDLFDLIDENQYNYFTEDDQNENEIDDEPKYSGNDVNIRYLSLENGRVIFEHKNDYFVLNIGQLSGSGDFELNTSLAERKGDLISIQRADGRFGIIVHDTGGEMTIANQIVDIIRHVEGDVAFTLHRSDGKSTRSIDGGTYMYTLSHRVEGDSKIWYLSADFQESAASKYGAPLRQMTPSAEAILGMAGVNRLIFDGEMRDLHHRMLGARQKGKLKSGAWGHYLHNQANVNQTHQTQYKLNQNGLTLGVDHYFEFDQGGVIAGAFSGYSQNTVKHARGGNSRIKSYHYGLYATYLAENGFYIDSVIKANHLDNKLRSHMTNGSLTSSNYKQNGFGTSLEAGYRAAFAEHSFVMPYTRLRYFSTPSQTIRLGNGMFANAATNRSWTGEMGVNVGTTLTYHAMTVKPYVHVAAERELIKHNDVVINGMYRFDNQMSGTTMKYGAGVNIDVSKNTTIYAEGRYQKGRYVENPLSTNLGLRIRF